MSPEKLAKNPRYLSLDIVRGVAAFSVLEGHWSGWSSQGGEHTGFLMSLVRAYEWLYHRVISGTGVHPGVVVFIALSGFCIHLPLASASPEKLGAHSWLSYAARRASRIGPLYWVGCLLGLIALFVERTATPLAPLGIAGDSLVFSAPLVVIKVLFIEPLTPWLPTFLDNGPLATVANEVWLYALYPFVLRVRKRWGFAPIFALGVALQLAALASVRLGMPSARMAASVYVFFLWWWLGAWAVERFMHLARDRERPAGWPWVFASAGAYFMFHRGVHFQGSHYVINLLLAVFTAALLCSSIVTELRRERPLPLVARALSWFGERSYSLYAIHAPVLVLSIVSLRSFLPGHPLAMRALPMLAVILASLALFRWVEQPSMRLGVWLSKQLHARRAQGGALGLPGASPAREL